MLLRVSDRDADTIGTLGASCCQAVDEPGVGRVLVVSTLDPAVDGPWCDPERVRSVDERDALVHEIAEGVFDVSVEPSLRRHGTAA